MSPMPGTTVGIELGIDGLCQRPMRVSTPVDGRGTVDRRPEQWVAERNSRTDGDEFGRFGSSSCFDRKTNHGSGLPEEHWIAGWFGRAEEQQPLRLLGELVDLTPKARLHAAHKRQRIRHRKAAGEARRRHTVRQLKQREWVAACLVDHPLTDPFVEPPWS